MFRKSIFKLFDIANECSNPLGSSNQVMRVSFNACSYLEITSDIAIFDFLIYCNSGFNELEYIHTQK